MDTKGQIIVFLWYLAIGFVCGILYDVFTPFRLLIRKKAKKNGAIAIGALDVAFWIGVCVLTGACAYALHLPTVREYAWLALLIGGIIYLKSLRRIVAFLQNLCYNTCKRIRPKQKLGRNAQKKAEREV
ncbi:MAG: spore cortex biosynthesis protein YabQ [Clostridia bacterium]|nr:spore cortex biosynthesis protein YabQ [Clostridia bacterium]